MAATTSACPAPAAPEGGILRGELLQGEAELFLVRLALWFNGDRDDRLREFNRFQNNRVVLIAQRVSGGRRPQADGGRNVAGIDLLALLPLVRMHLEQAPDPLPLSLGRVVYAGAGEQRAGINAEKSKRAGKGI